MLIAIQMLGGRRGREGGDGGVRRGVTCRIKDGVKVGGAGIYH